MSITRRDLFKGAMLGVCALPGWVSSRPGAAVLARPGRLQVDQVIFDARRCHALNFAETARGLGAKTCGFDGDVSHRRYQELFAGVRARKAAVAGLTDFPSLFLLQAMAADAGLHPVLRVHHRFVEDVDSHEAFGGQAYKEICESRFTHHRSYWATEAANLVMSLPAGEPVTMRQAGNLRDANLRVLARRAMVTWVIA